MFAFLRRLLRSPQTVPGTPEAGKGEERTVVVKRKPGPDLLPIRARQISRFAEACGWHEATVRWFQPSPPMCRARVMDIRHAPIDLTGLEQTRRRGHTPTPRNHLAFVVR